MGVMNSVHKISIIGCNLKDKDLKPILGYIKKNKQFSLLDVRANPALTLDTVRSIKNIYMYRDLFLEDPDAELKNDDEVEDDMVFSKTSQ